jgi:DNA-binding beta-propeller fold protein YncE
MYPGYVYTIAGSLSSGSTDGIGTNSKFYYPYHIAVSTSGKLYVADNANNKIRVLDLTGST